MNAIQTPALIVWLGSTPKLAELELCQHMLSLSQEDRRRVALVHIDTDEGSNGHQEDQSLGHKFRQGIAVPIDIDYASLPIEVWHTYIPAKKPQYYANGAGGIRNHGHVAATHDLQKVVHTLETALNRLEVLGNTQNQKRITEVHVNIVAFLGGGTGSGILGDIAVMVRQMLIKRQYMQRINIFCMLPDWTQGVDDNDIGWRKSNATACLLELIALSLVADTQSGGVYKKYMLNECYDVTSGAIASEVFLIGRTDMDNVDETARIVGLDLFQRITDASGVGQLEHSEWMNRRALGGRDDRDLPAMFGTSCPLEVIFPLHEVARAYAQVSTSYLLPSLINIAPPPPDIGERMREDWKNEWRDVATLEQSVQGKSLAVRPSREFSLDDFSDVGPDTLDSRWEELQDRQRETDIKIDIAIQKKREEEKVRINTVPRAVAMERISPLVRKITHLRLLEEEYKMVRDLLKRYPVEPPQPKPEWPARWFYSIPYLGNKFKQNKVERLRQEYNSILESHAYQTRYNLLLQTVEELLEQVQVRLNDALRWFSFGNENREQKKEELSSAGYNSAAWHGMLDRQHPHQRHIFDLNSFYDDRHEHNLAAKRLYLWATFSNLNERSIIQGIRDSNFVDHIAQARIDEFIERCTAYLVSGQLGNSFDAQIMDAEIELQSKEHLVDRVVTFFYEYYIEKFRSKNLFELLRIGSGPGRTLPISDYLHQHLYHIKGLIGSLIGFQPLLWPEGTRRLNTSVYLGMQWENGTQKSELERAVNRLGALTNRNQAPKIKLLNDPHRLQISYGEHGISLSTVQEFYRDTNSSMAEYIRYQSEWYGNQQPAIFPNPAPNVYGSDQMPVHSCGKMEELVCNPIAFGYSANQPHAHKYGTNLIGRVIRESTGLGNTPSWGGSPASGTGPGTAPGNPFAGTTPSWGGSPTSGIGPGTAPGGPSPAPGNPPGGGPGPGASPGGNPPPWFNPPPP